MYQIVMTNMRQNFCQSTRILMMSSLWMTEERNWSPRFQLIPTPLIPPLRRIYRDHRITWITFPQGYPQLPTPLVTAIIVGLMVGVPSITHLTKRVRLSDPSSGDRGEISHHHLRCLINHKTTQVYVQDITTLEAIDLACTTGTNRTVMTT